jgi:hypothetical protein
MECFKQSNRYVAGRKVARFVVHIVCAEGSQWWGIVLSEVSDVVSDSVDRADEWVATQA